MQINPKMSWKHKPTVLNCGSESEKPYQPEPSHRAVMFNPPSNSNNFPLGSIKSFES